MAALSERKKKILAAVVEAYIDTAEPVGSKHLAESAGLNVSSATIRNELADLVEMGFLEQPHASAGRVPTAKGYRLYVNELMRRHELSRKETEEINRSLQLRTQQLDKMMDDVGRIAAEMTNYPALAVAARTPDTVRRFDIIYVDSNTFIIVALLSGNKVRNKLMHLPFSVEEAFIRKLSTVLNANFTDLTEEEIGPVLISSTERALGDTMGLVAAVAGFTLEILSESHAGRTALAGEQKLLQLPEFRDPDKAHALMSYLSDASHLSSLPTADSFGGDVKMLIGPENIAEELKNSSVILAKYDAGDGMQGVIGVVGPTRMDYAAVAAKLSYIADGLSRALAAGGKDALPGFGKLMIKDKNE